MRELVGERFAIGDLLIAAIASEREGKVWSRHRDFVRMSRMGLVELIHPQTR